MELFNRGYIVTDGRYHRQSIIPNWDQQKIQESKVLILGVGALGTYLATNLALSGVGKLVLVDYDTIEMSNLNRQLLFNNADIGKNKAKVAAEKLKQLNPDIEIIPFAGPMQQLPKTEISGTKVIASCLDTYQGRRWANSLAIRESIPLVTGGMYAFLGNVQTILPNKTACFECQPLIPQEKLAQACSPLGEARKSQQPLKPEAPLPSVSTLSSIISGMMSQEIIKLLLAIGTPLNNYLFFDGLSSSTTILELKKNTQCPMCGDTYRLDEAPALVFHNEAVSSFKHRVALAFGLADPMLMFQGHILEPTALMDFDDGSIVYASDKRLSKPIGLKLTFSDDLQQDSHK